MLAGICKSEYIWYSAQSISGIVRSEMKVGYDSIKTKVPFLRIQADVFFIIVKGRHHNIAVHTYTRYGIVFNSLVDKEI